jgi:hypothetical protein
MFIRAISSLEFPIVFLLDDLHFADEALLDLLQALVTDVSNNLPFGSAPRPLVSKDRQDVHNPMRLVSCPVGGSGRSGTRPLISTDRQVTNSSMPALVSRQDEHDI